jgi:hypothetical protein
MFTRLERKIKIQTIPELAAEESLGSGTRDKLNPSFADRRGAAMIIPNRMKLRSVRCDCDVYDNCVCNV